MTGDLMDLQTVLYLAVKAPTRSRDEQDALLRIAGRLGDPWPNAVRRTWQFGRCDVGFCAVPTAGPTARLCGTHGGPAGPGQQQQRPPLRLVDSPADDDRCARCGARGHVDVCGECQHTEWRKAGRPG